MDDAHPLLATLAARFGAAAVVSPADAAGRPISIGGDRLPAVPLLRPAGTAEAAAMVRLVHEAGIALVPLGGGTGLAGGQLPASGREWYLSLERMRAIEELDAVSRIAVVQAGVVLQTLQEAVAAAGLLFGVDLGGRGAATVGGLLATNAGGERVLRLGMMREQVLGLEVVLADGTVLDLMERVLKNNAGYDLKQLFIGSEGTLGIVTRAVLRLRPAFASRHAAVLALPALDALPALLTRLEAGLGGMLSAFELMWPEFLATMTEPGPDGAAPPHRMPLPGARPQEAPGWVLIEAEGGDEAADGARFGAVLEALLAEGAIADAAVARSEAERRAFWAMRNDAPHIVRRWQPLVSLDVSVPIAQMVSYVDETRRALAARWPAARLLPFGHVADNNVHMIVTLGPGTHERYDEIAEVVYAGVRARRGSISAEHGVGLDKRAALARHRPPEALALMRRLKALLDPQATLNPGKVV
ncbi:MAG: FAD-binding oxidoreductase [Rubrivivax sp.]